MVLQLSRFPWGGDPAAWLKDVALAADEAGFAGIALMDHLIQIPQVGSAWEPIPEPWVTLGMLAGLDTRLRLGTLVTPVTFRPAGITAKTVATLDAISGGRAFVGVGAGWWEREHLAFGLPFPGPAERLDSLETAIETMRALWAKGTKAYDGERVALPETTSYPRPVGDVPVIVGGSGERRTLRIAARLGDGCNVPSDLETLDRKREVLRRHCLDVGPGPRRGGRHGARPARRGTRPRRRVGAGGAAARAQLRGVVRPPAQRRHRPAAPRPHQVLAEHGVSTVFVALPDLEGPEDLLALAPMLSGR